MFAYRFAVDGKGLSICKTKFSLNVHDHSFSKISL